MAHLITTKDKVWLGVDVTDNNVFLIIAGAKDHSIIMSKSDSQNFINDLVLLASGNKTIIWDYVYSKAIIIAKTNSDFSYDFRVYNDDDNDLLLEVNIIDSEMKEFIKYLTDNMETEHVN